VQPSGIMEIVSQVRQGLLHRACPSRNRCLSQNSMLFMPASSSISTISYTVYSHRNKEAHESFIPYPNHYWRQDYILISVMVFECRSSTAIPFPHCLISIRSSVRDPHRKTSRLPQVPHHPGVSADQLPVRREQGCCYGAKNRLSSLCSGAEL